jgi:hypothetical protein
MVLLAIAFFTTISGKPLDGALMLLAAVGLGWDAGRRARNGPTRGDSGAAARAGPRQTPAAPDGAVRVDTAGGGRRRWLAAAVLLAGGLLYAWLAGTFSRYSWPATVAVTGLGVVVVLIGWRGPLLHRPARDRLPAVGTAVWTGVLILGCLWELAALLRQPSLTATSYAHPTISALTDPVLASSGGRSAVLAAWLAIGWYLVRR